MIFDGDDDVKEYRPRKRRLERLTSLNNYDGYPLPPDRSYNHEGGGILGGVSLSTSEILDFSEGADSH